MRYRKLDRPSLWMAALLFFIFVAVPVFGTWGAYRSLKAWQGCGVVGAASPSGYGYACADGRKYP